MPFTVPAAPVAESVFIVFEVTLTAVLPEFAIPTTEAAVVANVLIVFDDTFIVVETFELVIPLTVPPVPVEL